MGLTTVVEFDHDFAGEIFEHRGYLFDELELRLSSGESPSTVPGVRYVTTFHRSGNYHDHAFETFKRALRSGGYLDYEKEFRRAAELLGLAQQGELHHDNDPEITDLIAKARR